MLLYSVSAILIGIGRGVVELDDWKRELFWCFVGSAMGTAFTELVEKLKEKTSKRSGKHFKRSK